MANSKSLPDFARESELKKEGMSHICGVDEVGRGPWAGPVIAAAVILDPKNVPEKINDSKKMNAVKREQLFDEICAASQFAFGICSVEEIDELNILQASLLAMQRAVERLPQVDFALIDGNKKPNLSCPCETIVKGDSKSLSIAAASIIAKVTRDREMCALHEKYPDYGWDSNMGYGTKKHAAALAKMGVTPWHRRSFKPVRERLAQDKV